MARSLPVTEPELDTYERERMVEQGREVWERMAWVCWSILSLRSDYRDRERADAQFSHAVRHFREELQPYKNRRKEPWIYAKFAEAVSTLLGHMMFGVRELSKDQMGPYVASTAKQFAKEYRKFLDNTQAINPKAKEKYRAAVRGHQKRRQPQPFRWTPVEGSEHDK